MVLGSTVIRRRSMVNQPVCPGQPVGYQQCQEDAVSRKFSYRARRVLREGVGAPDQRRGREAASQLSSVHETARALDRRIKHYVRFPLLCIDELGYLSYGTRAADLRFEIGNRWYAAKRPIGAGRA